MKASKYARLERRGRVGGPSLRPAMDVVSGRLLPTRPPPPPPRHATRSPRPSPSPRPRPRLPHTPGPPLEYRGRDPYGNVPGVGDTRYVPWAEGGKGGTVGQVAVLGDWDDELDRGDYWVISQGSNGEGGQ